MLKIPELGTISLKRISSSRLGSVLPVVLALVAIWTYFGQWLSSVTSFHAAV